MMMIEFFERMFAYDIWCAERLHDALRSLPDAEGAVRLYAHLIGSQQIWLARIEGKDTSGMTRFPEIAIDVALTEAHIMAGRWSALLGGSNESDLDRIIPHRSVAGEYYETPLREILTQVINHGTYHRGQIASMIRQHGGIPPVTDYIAYSRL